jgi:hypothetical protein
MSQEPPPSNASSASSHFSEQSGRRAASLLHVKVKGGLGLSGTALALALAALGASVGCSSSAGNKPGGATGTGGNGSGASGAGGASAGNGAGGSTPSNCVPSAPNAQRLVRLTFDQVATSLKSLLGESSLMGVELPGITGKVRQRKFQALFSEGGFINTDVLTDTVNMTEGALGNLKAAGALTALSGCAAPVTDACAQQFLPVFAEKAYRRPLVGTDQADVLAQYASYTSAGWSVEDALRYTLEAILISPAALYRSELGQVAGATATLTPFEVASQLSYFLQNGPPDAPLVDAAKAGALTSPEAIAQQVQRLLGTPATVENLNQVMAAYYGLGEIDATVKDPMLFPQFVGGIKNSMYTETDTFLRKTLWQGKVTDLLTSKTTYINKTLADFYGVAYPGAAGSETFEPFQFPDEQGRGGILTQGAVLSMRSRTDRTSVVSRGLYVNSGVLCQSTPPSPPAAVQAQVDAQLADMTATERQKADFRDTTAPCSGCHLNFDQYGLALETFDAIGRYRKSYPNGTMIDASSTLPANAGGVLIKDAAELSKAVADNGVFTRCLTSNLIKYALAEEVATLTANDCAVEEVVTHLQATDQSFTSLVREIALSKSLSQRAVGAP